jgi:para-nitrobenzyl esterase
MTLSYRSMTIYCLILMSGICVAMDIPELADRPQLQINDNAVIVGQKSEDRQTESFLGVPFAQPPIGEDRWAPPKPMEAATGIYKADKFSAACMQGDHITTWYKGVAESFGGDPQLIRHPRVNEDCLYLNIWRPVNTSDSPQALPVIVYIHGGSNKGGWSYEPNYIGHKLSAKGIIVISIAYRLGVFGFFSHPAIEQSNFGLLDQISALQWVNNNIVALGGDVQRITVMGESAGANNIDYLMTSPASKGLFSRVIHQSGGSSLTNRGTPAVHLKVGTSFAHQAVGSNINDPIDALRKLSAEEILTTATQVFKDHYFDPVVDGHSVLEPIMETIKADKMHSVDLLIGSNNDEWLMYTDAQPDIDGWLEREVAEFDAAALKKIVTNETNDRRKLDLLRTAKYYVCPSLVLANEISSLDRQAWVYHFTRQREGKLAATMGAYHGAELPYIFDTHDDWLPTVGTDHRLTNIMQSYWANFAATGNPNQSDLADWPRYNRGSQKVQTIGDTLFSSVHGSKPLCDYLSPN